MPSFDVVNKVDMQEISNTVNNAKKEILQRFDFRGSNTEVELDEKDKHITITTEDEMKMEAVRDILLTHATRRKLDVNCLEFKETQAAGGKTLRREVIIKEGIEQVLAKKMVKDIKDKKMKVQASIQGDELRISGKKIDDLQAVIALLKGGNYEIPLQFINMRD
jgi:cyclic-di-GMP-binding protein